LAPAHLCGGHLINDSPLTLSSDGWFSQPSAAAAAAIETPRDALTVADALGDTYAEKSPAAGKTVLLTFVHDGSHRAQIV
jgi:hypothetical protein